MSCDEVLGAIEEVWDGEASPGVRERVAAHLLDCAGCRAQESALRTLEDHIARSAPAGPPVAYWDELPSRVLARIERDASPAPVPASWRSGTALRYGALAASVMFVLTAAALRQLGTGGDPDPAASRDDGRASAIEPYEPPSEPELVGDGCDELRSALGRAPAGSSDVRDLRYELARCAVGAYRREPTDASRDVAESEAETFLALEPVGPRAAEIGDFIRTLSP